MSHARFHRIELELRTGHPRPVQHRRSADDRTEVLAALGKTLREESTSQRIDQAIARRVVGFAALDLEPGYIVGNGDQFLVRVGSYVEVYVGTHVARFLLLSI